MKKLLGLGLTEADGVWQLTNSLWGASPEAQLLLTNTTPQELFYHLTRG